jgi:hypothetical protein
MNEIGKPATQLVQREPRPREVGLAMVYSPAEARKRLEEMQAFVKSVMVAGVDFMVIPGTPKPSLLQPGAQKLAEIYGFSHRHLESKAIEDFERGFFYCAMKCILTLRRSGDFIGEGIGSANSKESKYADRWLQAKDLPEGTNIGHLRSKENPSKFAGGKPYTTYLVSNPNPADLLNTIQKMAKKRAYVDAVISVTRSSGLFTQDLEKNTAAIPAEAYGVADEERSWEREEEPTGVLAPEPPMSAPAENLSRVVHRDLKPDNGSKGVPSKPAAAGMTESEAKAVRELGPALERATTPEEVEILRREAVLAARQDPDNPRKRMPTIPYWTWYQGAIRTALARVGSGS